MKERKKIMGLLNTILIITVIGFFLFYNIVNIRHFPDKPLDGEILEAVKRDGLGHFTTHENTLKIQQEGFKTEFSKPMQHTEKDMVWFYLATEKDFAEHQRMVQSKGYRRDYDTAIIIRPRNEDLRNYYYRDKDLAIVHKGAFIPDIKEIRKIEKKHL